MTIRSIIRTIGAITMIAGLAACQSTTMPITQGPEANAVPIDVTDLRDRYLASNPGSDGLPLFRTGRDGFILAADGSVTYNAFKSNGNVQEFSRISTDEGNRVCVAPVDRWSGACFSLFRMNDGTVQVVYEFGNGAGGSYTARGISA